MLLKQLLNSPRTSSSLLVFDPFRDVNRQELVKEVIGLANADVEGPRHILFGVNSAAVDGDGVVGIPEAVAAELKKAHRLVSSLVQPMLDLAFVYDQINGKLVGALEIDGCDFGPYFVGEDYSDTLSRGASWVRDGRDLSAFERSGLPERDAANDEPASAALVPDDVDVLVGFGDRPDCQFVELGIPDTSNPPFAEELKNASKPVTIGKVIKNTVSTVTTQILRLGKSGSGDAGDHAADGSETGVTEHASKVYADAQKHYFYEDKAVKLELSIRNNGAIAIEGATIEFGFPKIAGFDVADRIYASPFDRRAAAAANNPGYPEVEARDDAFFVRSALETLAPGGTAAALRCPLRMAVGPGMQGRKLGIQYILRGPDNTVLSKGGLKIRFGEVAN